MKDNIVMLPGASLSPVLTHVQLKIPPFVFHSITFVPSIKALLYLTKKKHTCTFQKLLVYLPKIICVLCKITSVTSKNHFCTFQKPLLFLYKTLYIYIFLKRLLYLSKTTFKPTCVPSKNHGLPCKNHLRTFLEKHLYT